MQVAVVFSRGLAGLDAPLVRVATCARSAGRSP